jgi:hypothetical protein
MSSFSFTHIEHVITVDPNDTINMHLFCRDVADDQIEKVLVNVQAIMFIFRFTPSPFISFQSPDWFAFSQFLQSYGREIV